MSPRRRTTITGTPLTALADSWSIALAAANKAANTIYLYLHTARMFTTWLDTNGLCVDSETVTRDHVRRWIIHERERTSASTALTHFNNLRIWFNWMIAEGERTTPNPVSKDDAPKTTSRVKRYLTEDQQRALLATCKGPGFQERRDTAILRILMDNGMRVDGLAGIRLDGVDLRNRVLKIRLKGGDELLAPIGARTTQAIDRYLRARAAHRYAASPALWLGLGGTRPDGLTSCGIRRIVRVRGEQAGITGLHPHMFRATTAHALLAAGMNLDEVQHTMGWKTLAMVQHYAGDLAVSRARETHARLSPGDRI